MAELDYNAIIAYVYPVIKTILMLLLFFASTVGTGYYLFVIKRRRLWNVNIWEKKADGRLQLIMKDVLTEKKVNKGKQMIYKFKKQNDYSFPPPWECVYRIRGKEYCDYLRIRDDYLPMQREITGVNNLPETKKEIISTFRNIINSFKKGKGMTKEEVDKNYITLPINQSMTVDVKFKPMDYDVNMMRVNAIDIRDKIYMDREDWMKKYGTFVAFGMIVVLIIVVLYLSYDYSGNVIAMAMGKSQETVKMIQAVANQMGGSLPAQ